MTARGPNRPDRQLGQIIPASETMGNRSHCGDGRSIGYDERWPVRS
jgi:hypothetical protein